MSIIDRYIFGQLLRPFLFFMMVFVGLLWLNQALSQIDIVIENGQPASVFLELVFYLLPNVLAIAIPISGFAAAVYLTNRLYSESELVVMMNTGLPTRKIARPYLLFGCVCALAMGAIVHAIQPLAKDQLTKRQYEITSQYLTQIVTAGEFTRTSERFTFFFGQKGENGDLGDIMINERLEDGTAITHLAQKGQIITEEATNTLLLLNGSLQQFDREGLLLSIVKFDSLAYDLTQFASQIEPPKQRVDAYSTQALAQFADRLDPVARITERNSRWVKTMLAFFTPSLGLVILLLGGFSRSGFLPRIIFAVVLMFAIDTLRGVSENWAKDGAGFWVQYLPLGILILIVLGCFYLNDRARRGPAVSLRSGQNAPARRPKAGVG